MSLIKRMLKQTATYWPTTPDGYGGVQFGAPEPVECRWEDKVERFTTADGREAVSQSVVYVGQDLEVGGYLALGDYSGSTSTTTTGEEASFTPPSSARPIRAFGKDPNLRVTEFLRIAWL